MEEEEEDRLHSRLHKCSHYQYTTAAGEEDDGEMMERGGPDERQLVRERREGETEVVIKNGMEEKGRMNCKTGGVEGRRGVKDSIFLWRENNSSRCFTSKWQRPLVAAVMQRPSPRREEVRVDERVNQTSDYNTFLCLNQTSCNKTLILGRFRKLGHVRSPCRRRQRIRKHFTCPSRGGGRGHLIWRQTKKPE